jgi:hypothetical protein
VIALDWYANLQPTEYLYQHGSCKQLGIHFDSLYVSGVFYRCRKMAANGPHNTYTRSRVVGRVRCLRNVLGFRRGRNKCRKIRRRDIGIQAQPSNGEDCWRTLRWRVLHGPKQKLASFRPAHSRRRTPYQVFAAQSYSIQKHTLMRWKPEIPEVGAIRKTRGADSGAFDLDASPKFSSDGGVS